MFQQAGLSANNEALPWRCFCRCQVRCSNIANIRNQEASHLLLLSSASLNNHVARYPWVLMNVWWILWIRASTILIDSQCPTPRIHERTMPWHVGTASDWHWTWHQNDTRNWHHQDMPSYPKSSRLWGCRLTEKPEPSLGPRSGPRINDGQSDLQVLSKIGRTIWDFCWGEPIERAIERDQKSRKNLLNDLN